MFLPTHGSLHVNFKILEKAMMLLVQTCTCSCGPNLFRVKDYEKGAIMLNIQYKWAITCRFIARSSLKTKVESPNCNNFVHICNVVPIL